MTEMTPNQMNIETMTLDQLSQFVQAQLISIGQETVTINNLVAGYNFLVAKLEEKKNQVPKEIKTGYESPTASKIVLPKLKRA